LFRTALQTGKRARSETAIGHDVVSLGAAAVELASTHCDLRQTECVVVGAGKMGTVAAKHLHANGAASITIVNRTLRRAQLLAKQIDAHAAPLSSLPRVLREAALVISAVGSGRFLITASMLNSVAGGGRHRLLLIDIGVPRDVEPAAADVSSAVVYSLEDLKEVVDRSLEARRAEIPKVEAIIDEQVEDYLRWYRSRSVAPLIASLRGKAEEIRAGEIRKLFARLPELDQRQRDMVIAASVTIINKLLHEPVTRLRATVTDNADADDTQLALDGVDLEAFSDRLQRQLDAHTAPLLGLREDG
jgi:glutamyl-tRNA reductase